MYRNFFFFLEFSIHYIFLFEKFLWKFFRKFQHNRHYDPKIEFECCIVFSCSSTVSYLGAFSLWTHWSCAKILNFRFCNLNLFLFCFEYLMIGRQDSERQGVGQVSEDYYRKCVWERLLPLPYKGNTCTLSTHFEWF